MHDVEVVDARRRAEVEERFAAAFGRSAELVASAPGRVNLLGEHTDYNAGLVLPTVIPQRTWIALASRSDRRVIAGSGSYEGRPSYELGREERTGTWIDYLAGVTRALAELGPGAIERGFEAWVESDVPVGAGLSSSAALEVATLRALRARDHLALDDREIAERARWGENHVVGAPVGILDPMACSLGVPGHALFLDTRTMRSERIALPSGVELVVVDSGIAHDHATGDYRTRRAECEDAARRLGVGDLSRLGEGDLARLDALPPVLGRRARHVITENARVERGVAAMRRGDLPALGALFTASHASMRDDYEVSVPGIDALVMRALEHPEVLGARLTGGGFGGAIVALVRVGHAHDVATHLAQVPGARVLVPGT